MPCPKHKVQRRHRDARRAANKLHATHASRCPRCNAAKLPHRVCSSCGFYNDMDVLQKEN